MLLFTLVAAEVHGSTSAGGATKAEACRKPCYAIPLYLKRGKYRIIERSRKRSVHCGERQHY